MNLNKVNIEEVFFIVGIGRSGTTLIQSMLNAHPDICSPPESHYIRQVLSSTKGEKITSLEELKSIIQNRSDINRLKVDFTQVLKNDNDFQLSYSDVFKGYLKVYASRENKTRIAEKDPLNILHLVSIKKHFPSSYIIHIIRDPRDVILSQIKVSWNKQSRIENIIYNYKKQFLVGRKYGKALFGERYIEIYYEDLLLNPNNTLKLLSNKLNIPFSSNMLNYYKTSQKIISKDELEWKKNVTKPVMSTNKNKWEKELSKKTLLKIEIFLEKIFRILPYNLSQDYSELIYLQRYGYRSIFWLNMLTNKLNMKIQNIMKTP